MKKWILAALIVLILPFSADALVSVRGYYRSNGTYVRPHYRTDPDGIAWNNFSYNGYSTAGMSYGTASSLESYLRKPVHLSKREKKVRACVLQRKTEAYCKSVYMPKKHRK